MKISTMIFAVLGLAAAMSGAAIAQSGPVATICSKEIAKYCP